MTSTNVQAAARVTRDVDEPASEEWFKKAREQLKASGEHVKTLLQKEDLPESVATILKDGTLLLAEKLDAVNTKLSTKIAEVKDKPAEATVQAIIDNLKASSEALKNSAKTNEGKIKELAKELAKNIKISIDEAEKLANIHLDKPEDELKVRKWVQSAVDKVVKGVTMLEKKIQENIGN